MNDNDITIGASGIDTEDIIKNARDAVAKKREDGTYKAQGLDGEKRANPMEFKNDDEFLSFYLDSLGDAAFVDISDFEIEESRPRFRKILLGMKKGIWSLLKFYTYRLWSQQNQINGLLLSGIEGVHERQQEQIRILEKRIADLESR